MAVRSKINANVKKWRKDLNKKRSWNLDYKLEIEKKEEDKYCSGYKDFTNDTIQRVIYRFIKPENGKPKENYSSGEILFGYLPEENSQRMVYDVLTIDMSECGVVPGKFIPFGGKKIELYPYLKLGKDNPYEVIFKKLEEHFEKERNSSLKAGYLFFLYLEFKKFMVANGADKDLVFFLEKRKKIPYNI